MQIPVYGMSCAHCEDRLCQAVKKIDGVLDAQADHMTNCLTVRYAKKPDMAVVRSVIEQTGYSCDTKASKEKTEDKTMEKRIGIEGMMCTHCEAAVRKALESLSGVEKAEVSKDRKEAVVVLSKEVDDTKLKKAIEDAGYTVTSIQ